MSTLLSTIGAGVAPPRVLHRLTSGALIAVYFPNNASTNMLVQISTNDGSTWSTVATLTNNGGDQGLMSSAIDAGDNIHIAWYDGAFTLKYVALTHGTADSYGVGTVRTVFSDAGNSRQPIGIDIDTLGNGTALAAAFAVIVSKWGKTSSSGTQPGTLIKTHVIPGGTGTVYTGPDQRVMPTEAGTSFRGRSSLTVTGLHVAATSANNHTFAMAWEGSSTTSDPSKLVALQFNTSSTVMTVVDTKSLTLLDTNTVANLQVFNPSGRDILLGAYCGSQAYLYKVTLPDAGTFSAGLESTQTNSQHLGTDRGAGFYYANSSLTMVTSFGVIGFIGKISGSSVTWIQPGTFFTPTNYPTLQPLQVAGGANRNFNSLLDYYFAMQTNQSGTVFKSYYASLISSNTAVMKKPTGSQSTDFPLLEARFNLTSDNPAIRYKMTFQVASNSAMTANVHNYTQPDTALSRPQYSSSSDIRADYIVDDGLFTGTWWARAATVDEYGNQGAWSPTISFPILHTPSVSGLSPNGVTVAYGSGNIPLSWTATDPSPDDGQRKYQVIVEAADTGTVIYTSPLTTDTTQGMVWAMSHTYTNTNLRFKVQVTDKDGTTSTFSSYATFQVADAPTVTISSPTVAQVLATGQPTLTWSGVYNGTIKDYRVLITSGSTVTLDTGWVTQAGGVGTIAGSYTVPSGKLGNLKNFTFTIYVRDVYNLVGQASVSFSTSFPQPAAVTTTKVYDYDYATYGTLHIGWDSSAIDANFYSWNLYRQEVGQTTPELLQTFYQFRPVYGYRDKFVKSNTRYIYWVTQSKTSFGSIVESATGTQIQVLTTGDQYWLIDSGGVLDSVPLFRVTSDSWTEEHEESVYTVLGRGRHVDVGESLGLNGSITAQLRNKYNGILAGSNWIINSSMQASSNGYTPDGWTVSSSGAVNLSSRYDTYIEPAPDAKLNNLVVTCSTMPVGSGNYISVRSPATRFGDTDLAVGKSATAAMWIAEAPVQGSLASVAFFYEILDVDDSAILATGSVAAAIISSYGGGRWKRWAATFNIPTGIPNGKIHITARISTTTAMGLQFYLGGMSLNAGSSALPYFDGYMQGAHWVAGADGASYSDGTYSARDQRSDVFELKDTNRPVYLRTPFGDMLLVSIGDEGANRIAGVGSNDISDITLPVREVAF